MSPPTHTHLPDLGPLGPAHIPGATHHSHTHSSPTPTSPPLRSTQTPPRATPPRPLLVCRDEHRERFPPALNHALGVLLAKEESRGAEGRGRNSDDFNAELRKLLAALNTGQGEQARWAGGAPWGWAPGFTGPQAVGG